jgi:lactose/L-arabinose transport system substrate-binding protein
MLIGAMVASMAACGSSSSSSSSTGSAAGEEQSTGQASAQSDDENTLTLYAWDANFNIPALEAAADDYREKVNPDFELNIIEQSSSSDVETAITTAASAGNYETLPDIVLFQDHYIQSYVSDYPDAWIPVEGADINWDDFGAEKLSYSTIDGVHYGVPVDGGTAIAAYRVDLLEEAGYTIDDLTGCTWDEFLDIGEAVYNATGKYLMTINSDGNDLIYIMLQAEGESWFKDGEPYVTENQTLLDIIDVLVEASQRNVLYMPNSWSEYTNTAIQGDMVAGVMNGNWIIPTIESVEANAGKWEITTIPTFEGTEGYASNGGSSLYITANCSKVDLAKDFLAKTFGSSTDTYDAALLASGVVSTYIPAAQSEVYSQGVEYFNNTPIYAEIAEWTANVPTIEQNDYHYTLREQLGSALINIINGADKMSSLQDAEDQVRFSMGL